MGRVRALAEDDIPQIADLYQRVFGGGEGSAPDALRSYLKEILCRHPWPDEALPSLVYEDDGGRIVGCLGVMPRPMSMNGRPVRAAVSHTVMVEPGHRSTLAGLELIKAYFAGPQELSMAEGNSTSRRIWEALGGTRSLLHSLRWTRPVRPARYALAMLGRRGVPAPARAGLYPVSLVVDAVLGRLPESPFRHPVPAVSGEEVTAGTFQACLAELALTRSLWPEYDEHSLKWLLEILRQKTHLGAFRGVLVRNAGGDAVGTYLYYVNPGGVSEVVQVLARPDSAPEVLDHLAWDAWQHGALALSGQLDPALMQALSDRYCRFRLDADSAGVWIHAKAPGLLQAILSGDALLTRLECEWWISFRG